MAVAIILAIVIALIVCLVFYSQMKSVAIKQDAKDYMTGSLNLTQQSDIYINTTTSRVRVQSSSNKK